VRTASHSAARIGYLSEVAPVTPAILELAEPVSPLEVFRFAAPCAESGCVHYADDKCGLAGRIVNRVPVAVSIAPACPIRSKCRWWAQEGVDACRRCPQVVTRESGTNESVAAAAVPQVSGSPRPVDQG
jgi:hypothetical protein